MSTKDDQLEWRRSKVVEMRARDMTHQEIAHELQVSRTSITSNIQYLRSQDRESIKEYVTDHLPEQYQVCLSALDTIIRHAFEILETSHDNTQKIQSMELFKDTHLVRLELLSNGTTIDSALGDIRDKQQQQEQEQKRQQQQVECQKGLDIDSTTTMTTTMTNCITEQLVSKQVNHQPIYYYYHCYNSL